MPCATPQSARPASTAPDWATAAMRPAFQSRRPEARIQSDAWRGKADAVGPDDTQQIGLGGPQQALAPARIDSACIRASARPGADHDGSARAELAQRHDQAGNGLRRSRDHGEIRRRWQLGDLAEHGTAFDRAALGVHQK